LGLSLGTKLLVGTTFVTSFYLAQASFGGHHLNNLLNLLAQVGAPHPHVPCYSQPISILYTPELQLHYSWLGKFSAPLCHSRLGKCTSAPTSQLQLCIASCCAQSTQGVPFECLVLTAGWEGDCTSGLHRSSPTKGHSFKTVRGS